LLCGDFVVAEVVYGIPGILCHCKRAGHCRTLCQFGVGGFAIEILSFCPFLQDNR